MSDAELTSTGLMSDGTQPLDTAGRPISPRRRRWGMNVNILCAALGTMFAVVYWPGSGLFAMYMQERLGASAIQIGAFSSIVGIGQFAQLVGVYIFDRTRTRKHLWVALVLLYRFSTLAVVGIAIYANLHGAAPQLVWVLLAMMTAGFTMAQLTANAWWSWMADLAPQAVRGKFLANRQLAATGATLLGTLPVLLLDAIGKNAAGEYTEVADYIFIGIFALCSISGIVDIIIHAYIPEPARLDRPDATGLGDTLRNLAGPLRDKSFWPFTLATTLGGFAVMTYSPFVWPYLKDPQYLNVPYWLFFATIALHCVGQFVGSKYWGLMVDRFGSKPVWAFTYGSAFLSLYLFFITPENAVWLVLFIGGLAGGLMWSGMMVAGAQLMLTLSPQKTRNSYVAMHGAITGTAILAAPLLGGLIAGWAKTAFPPGQILLPTGTAFTYMQLLAVIGLVIRVAVYPLVMRVREGKEKPMGTLLATVLAPTQFRTLWGLRLLTGRDTARRIKAIRRMGSSSDQVAVDDLIGQLEDAEPEVRREATLALGRIGGPEATRALVRFLTAPESDVQHEAARALGMTGDPEALGPLVGKLQDPNELVRETAAGALGELKDPEAVAPLMDVLRNDPSPRVKSRGALALAKLGVLDAIWEILPKMHQTGNVALRRQLATAVGNLIGPPERFYHLMNLELRDPSIAVVRLVRESRSRLKQMARKLNGDAPQSDQNRHLRSAADRLGQAFEAYDLQQYGRAIDELHAAARDILVARYGFDGSDDVAVEFALSRRGDLGVGLWFLQVAKQYAATSEPREAPLQLDALLGFHFMHGFLMGTQRRAEGQA